MAGRLRPGTLAPCYSQGPGRGIVEQGLNVPTDRSAGAQIAHEDPNLRPPGSGTAQGVASPDIIALERDRYDALGVKIQFGRPGQTDHYRASLEQLDDLLPAALMRRQQPQGETATDSPDPRRSHKRVSRRQKTAAWPG
jgi:hypothetical protein